MATLLENVSSTDEKTVVRANFRLLGSTSESLVVEFDQKKFEQLLFLGSISPKPCESTVKSLGDSLSSLIGGFLKKTSSEVNRMLFDNVNNSTSLKIHATSFGANTTCDEVSQETCTTSIMAQGQQNGGDQSRRHTPFGAEKTRCRGVLNNSCEPSGSLIVDKDIEIAVSKQNLKTMFFAVNAILAISPIFLLQNVILAFKRSCRWEASCVPLLQNVMLAFNIAVASE